MQPLWTFTVASTCPYTLLTTSKTKEDGLLGNLYDLLLQPSTIFQSILDSEVRIIDTWVIQEQMTHSFTPSTQGWMLSRTKGTQRVRRTSIVQQLVCGAGSGVHGAHAGIWCRQKHTHRLSYDWPAGLVQHSSRHGKLDETGGSTEGTFSLRERCRRQYFCHSFPTSEDPCGVASARSQALRLHHACWWMENTIVPGVKMKLLLNQNSQLFKIEYCGFYHNKCHCYQQSIIKYRELIFPQLSKWPFS